MPTVFIKAGEIYVDRACTEKWTEQEEENAAIYYGNQDADGLCVLEFSTTDEEHEKNISAIKHLIREADIPIYAGGLVKRFEDVKKYFYAGAKKVLFLSNPATWDGALFEAAKRFGRENLISVLNPESINKAPKEEKYVYGYYLERSDEESVKYLMDQSDLPIIAALEQNNEERGLAILSMKNVIALTGSVVGKGGKTCGQWKKLGREACVPMKSISNKFSWKDFKLNSDGMVPVIVQDYKTEEVLMLAYMNEEAFEHTITSGKMTYYSRSRGELWEKGMTSGHYQYVKSLTADCDRDTILAKVYQVGAACHTGARSCFFEEILKKEFTNYSPSKVFHDVYEVISDRKMHPKEGSYTNYLFEKGIDKILKKIGEEATEIVIAAKNPDPEEICYEMADFLYHAMVLMAEKGITWEEITRELANR